MVVFVVLPLIYASSSKSLQDLCIYKKQSSNRLHFHWIFHDFGVFSWDRECGSQEAGVMWPAEGAWCLASVQRSLTPWTLESEERISQLFVSLWCVTTVSSFLCADILHASHFLLRTRLFCSRTSHVLLSVQTLWVFSFKGINLFSSVVLTNTFIRFCKVWIFIYYI